MKKLQMDLFAEHLARAAKAAAKPTIARADFVPRPPSGMRRPLSADWVIHRTEVLSEVDSRVINAMPAVAPPGKFIPPPDAVINPNFVHLDYLDRDIFPQAGGYVNRVEPFVPFNPIAAAVKGLAKLATIDNMPFPDIDEIEKEIIYDVYSPPVLKEVQHLDGLTHLVGFEGCVDGGIDGHLDATFFYEFYDSTAYLSFGRPGVEVEYVQLPFMQREPEVAAAVPMLREFIAAHAPSAQRPQTVLFDKIRVHLVKQFMIDYQLVTQDGVAQDVLGQVLTKSTRVVAGSYRMYQFYFWMLPRVRQHLRGGGGYTLEALLVLADGCNLDCYLDAVLDIGLDAPFHLGPGFATARAALSKNLPLNGVCVRDTYMLSHVSHALYADGHFVRVVPDGDSISTHIFVPVPGAPVREERHGYERKSVEIVFAPTSLSLITSYTDGDLEFAQPPSKDDLYLLGIYQGGSLITVWHGYPGRKEQEMEMCEWAGVDAEEIFDACVAMYGDARALVKDRGTWDYYLIGFKVHDKTKTSLREIFQEGVMVSAEFRRFRPMVFKGVTAGDGRRFVPIGYLPHPPFTFYDCPIAVVHDPYVPRGRTNYYLEGEASIHDRRNAVWLTSSLSDALGPLAKAAKGQLLEELEVLIPGCTQPKPHPWEGHMTVDTRGLEKLYFPDDSVARTVLPTLVEDDD